MIGLEFDYDPAVWLPVPTSFPDDDGLSVDGWAAGQAARARARGVQDSPQTGPVDNFFLAVAEFAREQGGVHDEVWMLVAQDAPGVLMLLLDVAAATMSLNDRLEDWSGFSELQYEPAVVTQLISPGLGEGYLVIRNDLDPNDRSIYATLNAVFRARGHDVIVSTQSYDTAAFNAAIPRIREFVEGISVVDQASPV